MVPTLIQLRGDRTKTKTFNTYLKLIHLLRSRTKVVPTLIQLIGDRNKRNILDTSSSLCHAASTDFPDFLSPFVSIFKTEDWSDFPV